MPKIKLVCAVALSGLWLAGCGSRGSPTAENAAALAETNALDEAGASGPGPGNGSAEPAAESFPPPDAVSHPDGFLPYGEDAPAPNAAEPSTANPPPATEDEYIRNRQAGP
jgi:hypothetical protein